jgi:hypothetical protein
MKRRSTYWKIRDALARIKRFVKREPEVPPDDPYAYVGAPKKPRLPQRSASATAELE